MKIRFGKIHGLGNDFIVIDELSKEAVPEKNKAGFAKRFCERRLSVGADGILFLQPSDSADFRMRVFNADGSEAENCVNGLRCASFSFFRKTGKKKFSVETLAGAVKASVISATGKTCMIELEVLGRKQYKVKRKLKVDGHELEYHFVDVGNPHAVIFMGNGVDRFPVADLGSKLELHDDFKPNRTNVEFVNVKSDRHLKMRVWERGVGETMACGSGSIAIVIAAAENGMCRKDEWVKVEQPGGILEIKYGNGLFLKGPAELSFEGEAEW